MLPLLKGILWCRCCDNQGHSAIKLTQTSLRVWEFQILFYVELKWCLRNSLRRMTNGLSSHSGRRRCQFQPASPPVKGFQMEGDVQLWGFPSQWSMMADLDWSNLREGASYQLEQMGQEAKAGLSTLLWAYIHSTSTRHDTPNTCPVWWKRRMCPCALDSHNYSPWTWNNHYKHRHENTRPHDL